MVIQPGQSQIGSSGRVVAAYPIQPRTLRIMDQRGRSKWTHEWIE
jgi:hypothetical protein